MSGARTNSKGGYVCVWFSDLQTCQSESKKFRMIGRLKVPDSQIVRKAKSDIYLSGTGGGGLLIWKLIIDDQPNILAQPNLPH